MYMPLKQWAIPLLAAAAVCGAASAEKLTVDPNAPGVQEERAAPVADKRVTQKVGYEAARKPVAVILDELSEQTGVSLRAGFNKFDWQVRDRKMSIFSKDAELSDLMNSIARVMKFKWSKEKVKGQFVYRLYMDRRTLLDADARKAREEERLAKLEADRRRKALQSLKDLADLTADEAVALRNTNPYKYALATSGAARVMSLFLAEAPSVSEALASGERLAVQADKLSAEGRRAMLQMMRHLDRLDLGDAQDIQDGAVDSALISVNGSLADIRYSHGGSPAILGDVQFVFGETDVQIELLDPDSEQARTVGEMLIAQMEDGKTPDEVEQQAGSRFWESVVSDVNKDTPEDPEPERPDDPEMHKKIKIKPKSNELPDVQQATAEASGFAVVSDFFTRTSGLAVPQGQEMKLADLLEKIGNSFKYDWDKPGPVIEFRDKRWFQKRAAQIPQAWIDKWRAKFKDSGMLDLDDFAQMAALTEEQFKENIAEDELLRKSGAPGVFRLVRNILKMYASFSATERFALFTEDGVDVGLLNADQQALLHAYIGFRDPLFLQRDLASLTLSASKLKFPHKLRYVFTIASNEDQEQIVQIMDVPKYQQPQEPADDSQ